MTEGRVRRYGRLLRTALSASRKTGLLHALVGAKSSPDRNSACFSTALPYRRLWSSPMRPFLNSCSSRWWLISCAMLDHRRTTVWPSFSTMMRAVPTGMSRRQAVEFVILRCAIVDSGLWTLDSGHWPAVKLSLLGCLA